MKGVADMMFGGDGTDSKITVIRKKHISTDEEQAVLDELAAFEAELAAELGQ